MPNRSFFHFSVSASCSVPENMNPPQSACACDHHTRSIFGHLIFHTYEFKKFQDELNEVELQEFSFPVNSCSSQCFSKDKVLRELLNPIHNNANIIMGQNQRIMHHVNAFSNSIDVVANSVTIDGHPVTQDVDPVLVETVTRRKTRVERFSSEI